MKINMAKGAVILGMAIFVFGVAANAETGATTNTADTATTQVDTTAGTPGIRPQVKALRGDIKETMVESRANIKTEAESARTDVKNIRQTATTSGRTKAEVEAEIDARRTEAKENIKDTRTDTKEVVKEKRAEIKGTIVKAALEKAVRRLAAAILRLETIASRIESRINKFEALGVDMAHSKTALGGAWLKIDEAKALVAALKNTALESRVTKDKLETLRQEVKNAHDGVKAAHAALVDVINSMKPGAEILRAKIEARSGKATTTPNSGTSSE